MKLNEVLIKNKVVNYDSSAPTGNRYIVLDESMNRVISTHATRESAEKQIGKLRNSTVILEAAGTPPPGVFPAGQIFPYGANGYAIGLGDDQKVIRFTNSDPNRALAQAQELLDNMDESDRTDPAKLRAAGRANVLDISKFRQGLNRRIARSEIRTLQALESIEVKGTTLRAVLQSPWWRGVGRMTTGLGLGVALIWTMFGVINDLENEANDDPNKQEENMELRNILVGQVSVQLLIILRIIFGNARLFNRALAGIKWTVRTVQAGVASTGVGAIPSAISFLLTEAGWLVAGWIITRPGVQLAMAEWFHGNLIGVVLGFVGTGVVGAATLLDAAFDGEYGTGALRRELGWPTDGSPDEAAEGEVIGTSEWAKLVFHGLLFPPGREKLLVPYIAPEQRATLLRQVLGLTGEEPTAPTGDSAADVEIDDAARVPAPQAAT